MVCDFIYSYSVEYTEASSIKDEWIPCKQSGNAEWTASNLRPKTRYCFRLSLQYVTNAQLYHWPNDDRFTFETIGIIN